MGDNQLNLNPNWMFINITDNSIKCETVFAPCFLQEFLSRDIVRSFQWNMMSGICFRNICDRGEVGRGRDEMIGQSGMFETGDGCICGFTALFSLLLHVFEIFSGKKSLKH